MTKRGFGQWGSLLYVGSALLVVAVLALGLRTTVAYAQQESPVERYYRLLMRISDETLLRLPAAMADLAGEGTEGRGVFFGEPRVYLKGKDIDLPVNHYQVVALDFSVRPEDPALAWFGVAEQQEGLTFVASGVGFFYSNVGIFIQAAVKPESPAAAPTPVMTFAPSGGTGLAIESYLQLIERIPAESLTRLSGVMEELNAAGEEDPRRVEFVTNPRDYLLKQDILLPSAYYRITAIDFQRAARLDVPVVFLSRTRGGLAVVPQGIGLFFNGEGLFIQEAI